MKKAFILVLTTFLTFTIFLSGKSANAELTPITPFYEGDILNGKELYLFTSYSANPNFENGYIGKKTISQQDVYYQENSFYNGWYKNLGEQLIYDYIYPETTSDETFIFYIKFDNMLVQYLQLALISPEPMVNEYYIKFSGESAFNFMSTDGYNEYLITPPTNDMTKRVEWLAFGVGFPDYMASFRPLTAQTAYDFGFSAGEMEGYRNGHNTGYNTGYQNGIQDAMEEGAQVQYIKVQYYNQLLQNNDFSTHTIWDTRNCSYTNINNMAIITPVNNDAAFGLVQTLEREITSGHITLCMFNVYSSGANSRFRLRYPYQSDYVNISTINTRYYIYYNNQTLQELSNFYIQFSNPVYSTNTITLSNINFIDLTLMYGTGNEPTLQECQEIFSNRLYPYSTGEIGNVGYYNGYAEGVNVGIEKGKDIQATTQLTSTGWISSIFEGISSFLNIQIFPGVTLGIIVGIPFVISLAYFVIRAFRGGGGD